ncbi:unnamed protein product [Didymodactylos carnosus]|uniref:Retrotransposon gag domain-containing protein n=1 Tax=Didymodactylos carnosus TaxID=1234261 RepID=A0A814GT11_9BILA|nr:unnamed protein product [Didymodactylos carnosus]CAF3772166.1 unnamed protein product [Didymodactylos carnosus]
MALSLQNLLLSSLTPSTTSELQSFCELLPFTGDVGQNVVHWLMAFNEACSTAGIDEDQHRLWLRFKLLGGPKSWYRLKQKTLLSYNWKKVQMALIETFGTFSQIEQASEILRSQIASHETENALAEFRSDKVAAAVDNLIQIHNPQHQFSKAAPTTEHTINQSVESIDPQPKSALQPKQQTATTQPTVPPATTITNKKRKAPSTKGASNATSKITERIIIEKSQSDDVEEVKTPGHEYADEEDEAHVHHENGNFLTALVFNVADTAPNIVEKITNLFTTNNDEKIEDDKKEDSNNAEQDTIDVKQDAEEHGEETRGYTFDERQEQKAKKLNQQHDQEDKINSLADPDLMVPSKDFERNEEKIEQIMNEDTPNIMAAEDLLKTKPLELPLKLILLTVKTVNGGILHATSNGKVTFGHWDSLWPYPVP